MWSGSLDDVNVNARSAGDRTQKMARDDNGGCRAADAERSLGCDAAGAV